MQQGTGRSACRRVIGGPKRKHVKGHCAGRAKFDGLGHRQVGGRATIDEPDPVTLDRREKAGYGGAGPESRFKWPALQDGRFPIVETGGHGRETVVEIFDPCH